MSDFIDPSNSFPHMSIKYKEDEAGKSLSLPESRFDERSSVCNAGRVNMESGISPENKKNK